MRSYDNATHTYVSGVPNSITRSVIVSGGAYNHTFVSAGVGSMDQKRDRTYDQPVEITAGYTAEILRGTIEETPLGEIEAAKACGMSKTTMYRRIILPGTFRRALPAYGNEVIFMLHGSALAGVITIVDLFGAAKIVNSRYFIPFESFITAGLFYLGCTFFIVLIFKVFY